MMGGGLIIRDNEGKAFAARSFMRKGCLSCLDLTSTKAMVTVHAAQFCKDMEVSN
jgi:hypothetical protein